jgi:hypothetical protein
MSDDEAQPYDIPAVWGQSDELDNDILDDLLDGNSAILALDVPKGAL